MFPLKDNIPTDRFPLVTVVLVVANVLMYFVFQKAGILSGPPTSNVVKYGAIPYELTHPGKHCAVASVAAGLPDGSSPVICEGQAGVTGSPPSQPSTILTVFTAMFMHGSIVHLGGNMLFLWIFGNNVEDSMGRVRFVAFYVLGGLAALGGQVLMGPDSAIPTIGASGAIAAVLGGYILLYPQARVVTLVLVLFFFTILELPAIFVLGLWFVEQILFGAADLTNPTGGAGGGVAYFAHIGGFVFGLALIRAFVQRHKSVEPRFPVY